MFNGKMESVATQCDSGMGMRKTHVKHVCVCTSVDFKAVNCSEKASIYVLRQL